MNRLTIAVVSILFWAGMFSLALGATTTVHTGSYYFEDATVGDGKIVARVGDRLQFLIEDGGKGTPHTVEVDELGIHSGALGTSSTYTTPVLSLPGTFLLYCKPHQNKGHFTNLVVLADATPAPTNAPTPVPTNARTPAPTVAPTQVPTNLPTAATTSTPPSGSTPTPAGAVSGGAASASSPKPEATGAGSPAVSSQGAVDATPSIVSVATSDAARQDRAAATTWLRSVFVAFLALAPLLGLTGLAGWLSSRRRSS